MFLELATTTGAIVGAAAAALVAPSALSILFGAVLAASVVPLVARLGEELPQGVVNDRWAGRLRLAGRYDDAALGRAVRYQVKRVPLGFAMMWVAGLIYGLLGIGSGTFKVLAMDTAMRLPMKVSTTTSNFMIGVTAAASAGVYFSRGYLHPLIATPVFRVAASAVLFFLEGDPLYTVITLVVLGLPLGSVFWLGGPA